MVTLLIGISPAYRTQALEEAVKLSICLFFFFFPVLLPSSWMGMEETNGKDFGRTKSQPEVQNVGEVQTVELVDVDKIVNYLNLYKTKLSTVRK